MLNDFADRKDAWNMKANIGQTGLKHAWRRLGSIDFYSMHRKTSFVFQSYRFVSEYVMTEWWVKTETQLKTWSGDCMWCWCVIGVNAVQRCECSCTAPHTHHRPDGFWVMSSRSLGGHLQSCELNNWERADSPWKSGQGVYDCIW